MNSYNHRSRNGEESEQVSHATYQIDFSAVNCGKLVSASKRRIRFKFGYANAKALSSGKRGTDCRGSEHEVVVTWSHSSGKQSVMYDGREVFFDVNENLTNNKLQHKWRDEKSHHVLEVVAHAAPVAMMKNPDPGWRRYDLFVDGMSYFVLPKIFQIGISSGAPPPKSQRTQRHAVGAGNAIVSSRRRRETEVPVGASNGGDASAQRRLRVDGGRRQVVSDVPAPASVEVTDLLSFVETVPAPAAPSQYNPSALQQQQQQQQQPMYPMQDPTYASTAPAAGASDGALVVSQAQQFHQYNNYGFAAAPPATAYPQAPNAVTPTSNYNAFAPAFPAPVTPNHSYNGFAPAPAHQAFSPQQHQPQQASQPHLAQQQAGMVYPGQQPQAYGYGPQPTNAMQQQPAQGFQQSAGGYQNAQYQQHTY